MSIVRPPNRMAATKMPLAQLVLVAGYITERRGWAIIFGDKDSEI